MLPAEQVAPASDEKIPHPMDEAALASDEAQRFAVTEESTKRALRVFHIYRMVVAGLLLLLYVADHETSLLDTLDNPLAFLQVVQVYAILVLMGYFVVHVSHMPLQPQIHSALLIDVVALTLIMHATGGVRIGLDVLLVPIHGGVEVGLHFEELLKVPVKAVEKVVELGVPNDDNLRVEGDGLRPQGLGRHEA